MTQAELEKRKDRAARETFVIKQTDDGYRIYTPGNPARNYLVSGTLDRPTCTCPDFEIHAADPEWHCKHIFAVLNRGGSTDVADTSEDDVEREERLAIQEESRRSEAGNGIGNSASQMLLKRSVSPDGRIDSLSVEFAVPANDAPAREIRAHARRVLELQSEIVDDFLARSEGGGPRRTRNGHAGNGATEARLLRIGGLDTKWGRRLFISVQVNGETLKLFGSRQQLADAIDAAGFPNRAEHIAEGVKLDLPCRVSTKRSDDGRYTNVDEVFPATSHTGRSGR